tara:strand:+ start:2363 stop:3649 length:1287 start_codon:yes stop_codon:yes gene_type:complete
MFSNNFSKPSEFFKSKSEYDKSIPPDIDLKTIDMWYNVPYFGKIDSFGVPVFPREVLLGNLDTDGKFQALKFVCRAFKTLESKVNRSKSKNAIEPSLLGTFTPKKAWESATELFDKYFENNIYNAFLNNFLNNKRISSFNCFVKEYINFCKLVAEDVSLTFPSFILSNNCTNRISGLIIDLSNDPHDDAAKKINDYFSDDQYITFLNLCESYGFKVNRNAPWQLVADLSNLQMREFAAAEGIDTRQNGLFDTLYYKDSDPPHITYNNFKRYLWQMYSDWFSVNTTYSKIEVKHGFNSSSPMFSQFKTKKINELPVELSLTFSELEQSYGELNFLKLYLKIRLIEVDIENKYDILVNYLEQYYNLAGIEGALAFVDRKLIKTNIYTSNELKPYFFDSKVLTSAGSSAIITQNINSPQSANGGGGSTSGY